MPYSSMNDRLYQIDVNYLDSVIYISSIAVDGFHAVNCPYEACEFYRVSLTDRVDAKVMQEFFANQCTGFVGRLIEMCKSVTDGAHDKDEYGAFLNHLKRLLVLLPTAKWQERMMEQMKECMTE